MSPRKKKKTVNCQTSYYIYRMIYTYIIYRSHSRGHTHKSQISDVEKNFRETNKASEPSETASRELRSRHWSSERRKKGLQKSALKQSCRKCPRFDEIYKNLQISGTRDFITLRVGSAQRTPLQAACGGSAEQEALKVTAGTHTTE